MTIGLFLQRTLTTASLLGGLLCASHAFAQTPEDEAQWYQINVLIFERIGSGALNITEYWPKDKILTYPTNIKYLNAPKDDGLEADENKPLGAALTDSTTQEQPFTLLKDELRGFNESERSFKRSNKFRVLFHKSWRQSLLPPEDSPAIVIQGGQQFDEHFELNGTLKFSVRRYLHMNADLWLTEFETNYGQVSGQWPELPKAPKNLDTLEFNEPENVSDPTFKNKNVFKQGALNDIELRTNLNAQNIPNNSTLLGNSDLNETAFPTLTLGDAEKFNPIEKKYIVANITTLKQTRRMRSGEKHYIDHPKLGIILTVTPYEKPEPVLSPPLPETPNAPAAAQQPGAS